MDAYHTKQVKYRFFILAVSILLSLSYRSYSQVADSIPHRPKLGLVLSGGGAKGIAHVGAIKVFEEAGLHFDYIGGTSMGSIIGGLYAIGYTPEQMADMIKEQNWNDLMTDNIPRKYIPIQDKFNADRFIASFPIENKKVTFKPALYNGILVELLLARLSSPVYQIFNYANLPTPFFCVAANLESGMATELNKGVLHRSIRASMSIPGYFAPIKINGNLYVDGGIIDNFPAARLREKGADIIVGVDVQASMYNENQLGSMLNIMDQIVSFYSMKDNNVNMQLIDYNIRPNIDKYGVLDFDACDTLIALGERAARAQFPQLKKLADSINAIEPYVPDDTITAAPLDSIYITGMVFEGLSNPNFNFIENAFNFTPPDKIAYNEIDEGILQLYGSGLFSQIHYYLIPNKEGARLAINFTENSNAFLNVGLHYDTDYKVGLLLNATLVNLVGKGSKMYLDLNIGENSSFTAYYTSNRTRNFSLGAKLKLNGLRFNQYKDNLITNIYKVNQNSLDIFGELLDKNLQQVHLGFRLNYSRFKNEIYDGSDTPYNWFINPYFNYVIDSYDRTTFSTRGMQMTLTAKYIIPFKDFSNRESRQNAGIVQLTLNKNIFLSQKFTLKVGTNVGAKIGDNELPMQYRFFVGGQSKLRYFDNFIPFTGLKFIEASGDYMLFGKFACQYNFYKKLYATLQCDFGWLDNSYETLFHGDVFHTGYGLTLGYDSLLGPIEVSLMGSNSNSGATGFINIGYWF